MQKINFKNIVFFLLVLIPVIGFNTGCGESPEESFERARARAKARKISREEAINRLNHLLNNITWTQYYSTRKAQLDLTKQSDIKDALPAISEFNLAVNPPPSGDSVIVEIFASVEKSGKGTDGWMTEAAQEFNRQNIKLKNGKTAKVRLREISSGTGYQFISSKKYLPDAYTPSNQLWIEMASAQGIRLKQIRKKLVGNIAGIVMKNETADKLRSAYGSLNVRDCVDAVIAGNMVMGYTNPFAASTGINFLVTILATFAGGEQDKLLSSEVVNAFAKFQQSVPYIALHALQLRDSVLKTGTLDAFIMEYQTFINTPVLKTGYEFIPYGQRHDNPLYAIGDPDSVRLEALEKFTAFLEQAKYRDLAKQYGFNIEPQHKPSYTIPDGKILIEAQKLWKEKKDAGRPIGAIFLADVSGSMAGTRLQGLKSALLQGIEFISPNNSIGLVEFSDKVNVVLPIRKFDLLHKSMFHAAMEDMAAEGGTAMYDGIAVSLSLLIEEQRKNLNIKPMLFVLTDGQSFQGHQFEDMRKIIEGIGIPIYTIGYEADLAVLHRLSSLVEAASINATEGKIKFKIGSLLNAQM